MTPEEVKELNLGGEVDGMFYVEKQLATQVDDILSVLGLGTYIQDTWINSRF